MDTADYLSTLKPFLGEVKNDLETLSFSEEEKALFMKSAYLLPVEQRMMLKRALTQSYRVAQVDSYLSREGVRLFFLKFLTMTKMLRLMAIKKFFCSAYLFNEGKLKDGYDLWLRVLKSFSKAILLYHEDTGNVVDFYTYDLRDFSRWFNNNHPVLSYVLNFKQFFISIDQTYSNTVTLKKNMFFYNKLKLFSSYVDTIKTKERHVIDELYDIALILLQRGCIKFKFSTKLLVVYYFKNYFSLSIREFCELVGISPSAFLMTMDYVLREFNRKGRVVVNIDEVKKKLREYKEETINSSYRKNKRQISKFSYRTKLAIVKDLSYSSMLDVATKYKISLSSLSSWYRYRKKKALQKFSVNAPLDNLDKEIVRKELGDVV